MIVAPSGKVLEQRADAREHLQNASVSTKWDRLNLVYFLGYAFWGYYTLPYQLLSSDIEWTELSDGLLQADYGTNLPVHSRIQRFWFDRHTGLLRRNDYTPVAAARDARAANVVFEHAVSNGIPYTSKRRVKMSLGQHHALRRGGGPHRDRSKGQVGRGRRDGRSGAHTSQRDHVRAAPRAVAEDQEGLAQARPGRYEADRHRAGLSGKDRAVAVVADH